MLQVNNNVDTVRSLPCFVGLYAFTLISVIFGVLCGCESKSNHPSEGVNINRMNNHGASSMTDHPSRIDFKLKEIKVSADGKSINGFFTFTNNTGRNVQIPGFSPLVDGIFKPYYLDYEVAESNGWNLLDISYDGIPVEFDIPTGKTTFVIDLGPFQVQKISDLASVRVRAGRYWSEPFTLQ